MLPMGSFKDVSCQRLIYVLWGGGRLPTTTKSRGSLSSALTSPEKFGGGLEIAQTAAACPRPLQICSQNIFGVSERRLSVGINPAVNQGGGEEPPRSAVAPENMGTKRGSGFVHYSYLGTLRLMSKMIGG